MQKFTLGTFNLLNLVLPGVRYYDRQYAPDIYAQKCAWIGQQLDYMQADIVGFQEVFHAEALQASLQHSAHLQDSHVVVAAENGSLPRVALASKFPIINTEVYEDFPRQITLEGVEIPIKSFSRPVLRAEVAVQKDLILNVFVVHLKSKRPALESGETRENPVDVAIGQARSLIRRAAEAAALRQILMETLQDRKQPVVLLGDVNDSGLAVTTRLISGEPPHRRYPQEVKQRIWDVLLYHVRDIKARRSYADVYYTHLHNGHYEALDHIMVSQELVQENPLRIGRIGQVRLFNDHLVDETVANGRIKPWQSDHGQVIATVELARERRPRRKQKGKGD